MLKVEEGLASEVLENVTLSICLFNTKTSTCFYHNRIARELLHLEADDMVFQLEALFPEGLPADQRPLNKEMAELQGVFQDVMVRKLDGDLMIANVGLRAVSEEVLLVHLQDATFQKKLQREIMTKQAEIHKQTEELQKRNAQLVELDKAKDRFFALTSHELRTPVASIVATAQFVEDGLCDNVEQVYNYVKVMLSEGRHLLELINDILDFSKIQAGKLDVFVEHLDPFEILDAQVEKIEKYAETKGVKIHRGLWSSGPSGMKAYFDQLRLTQVIDNVLSNAIKYNKDGGEVYMTCEPSEDSKFVKIAVRDTGPGIPQEHIDKVFNEFETVENIRNHQKGTGLGMPISKRLMELQGGKIYFSTEVGVGTTFFVEIPVEKVLEASCYRSRDEKIKAVA